jgi:plastocyanin
MVDNPKIFITCIIIFVVGLALLIGGYRFFVGKSASNQTGTTTSSNVSENTTVTQSPGVTSQGGSLKPKGYDSLVTYTSDGFTPNTLTVKAGTSVRFINKSSNKVMMIAWVESSGPPLYSEFKQSTAVGKNGTFDFNFSKKGVWLYQNINDTSKTGIVVVN